MSKTKLRTFFVQAAAAIAVLSLSAAAFAHDHWIGVKKAEPGQKATVVRGYGHGFPDPEALPEGRESVFTAVTLVDKDGNKSSFAKDPSDTVTFVSEKELENGSYVAYSEYQPTYVTTSPAGRSEKPKNEVEGATSCRLVAMYAKSYVDVGQVADNAVIAQLAAQKLEFVPDGHPGGLKVGDTVKIKLLFDGKPLPRTVVRGMTNGLPKGVYSYESTTDKDGYIEFVPLKSGNWIITANTKEDIPDKNVCDEGSYTASLYFDVK
ncbi:MAG: DUF4198 domain-containing protein [Deltaproteobacteria bacterium]|jgi:uncharacterized GH25 family protein|nr:DUF4198 domain-containing protein [Deltaproteobacteria bacterium]